MSIFGRDRQFMSDLELEEAGASLLRNNKPPPPTSTKPPQQQSSRNTNSNNRKSSNPNNFAERDRRLSQDSINNREFNDVFNQLGEAYTNKKLPEMHQNPSNSSMSNQRYPPPSSSGANNPNNRSLHNSRIYDHDDQDLIDMDREPIVPLMGSTASRPAGGLNSLQPPRLNSPVHSDHPSDLTEGTFNSRAGLVGVAPSRTSTQNRPSGAPVMNSNTQYKYPQSAIENRDRDRDRDIINTLNSQPDRSSNYNAYNRGYSAPERQSINRPITPPPEDFNTFNGPMGYGDTLTRGGGGGGYIDDDRRSHFSMATSVVSTIPLSTQPAATKTMSGLYALLVIMLGVAVTSGDVVSRRSYDPKYADFYSMYVFGVGTLAALYMCLVCVYGKRNDAPIDHHNGSIYIRIGAVVFCLGSLAHSAIILAETFQYQDNCYITARLGSISLRALFQVSQLFVVLLHSKVCIQSLNGLARLVLAHIIAANFFMWFKLTLKETEESIVVNVPRHYHNIRMFCARNYANSFTDLEEESTPILVPMCVAYCIIAGTTLFTMWRNIGKDYSIEHKEESCEEHGKQLTFKCREGVTGIMAGSFSILASISILVLWIMFSNDRSLYDYLVSIYQAYNAAWLVLLIFLFPIAAAALKRHKKQDHYHNSLNRPILIVCTTGTFAYCILNIMSASVLLLTRFSWVALATLLGYSIHAVETGIQTVYLLDGLRRCPRKKRKPASKSFVIFFLLVNVSLWITIIFELKENALNPLQEDFYGIINWQIMLHFVGPIASLYRFHSVCCFLDVWKFAY